MDLNAFPVKKLYCNKKSCCPMKSVWKDIKPVREPSTIRTLSLLHHLLGIGNTNQRTTAGRIHRCVRLVSLTGALAFSGIHMYSLVMKFVQKGHRVPLTETLADCVSIMEPMRSPLIILAFIFAEENLMRLDATVRRVVFFSFPDGPNVVVLTKNGRRSAILLFSSVLITYFFWGLSTWITVDQKSFSFSTLINATSSTFSLLGVSLVRWKFYLTWCMLILPPVIYSFIIQTLLYLTGYILQKGQTRFLQQLRQVSSADGKERFSQKLQLLLDFQNILFELAVVINKSFGWIAAIAFCVDSTAMLTHIAAARLLYNEPDYFELTGTAMNGLLLLSFPYPFMQIDDDDSVIETQICILSRDALPLVAASQGTEVKALLDTLLLSQQKLKLQLRAGGTFYVTWSLMIKMFALIASITLISSELITKDANIQKKFLNCTAV